MIFREFDEAEYMRLVEKDTERQIAAFKEEIDLQKEQLSKQSEELLKKDEQLETYKRMLEEHGLLTSEQWFSYLTWKGVLCPFSNRLYKIS